MALVSQNVEARLHSLLSNGNFNFHSESSSRSSHSLHAFAAKFPPQLPALFINELTEVGDTILDPMVGSGTTILEAYQLGRNAIGVDIDPLAVMICKVKTTRLDPMMALRAGKQVLDRATKIAGKSSVVEGFLARFPGEERQFVDYWFAPETQREIVALLVAIRDGAKGKLQDFLHLVLSSIIITKSGGVSLARDLAHSRPHKDPTKRPRSALHQFGIKLEKAARSFAEMHDPRNGVRVHVEVGDCRVSLPLGKESVDLVVTSPPYANAIDYMRAHKFSLIWFGRALSDLSSLRGQYIGAEKAPPMLHAPLPKKVERIVRKVGERDSRKSAILRRYFVDMTAAMAEVRRVLRPRRAAIIVVGPSTIRGYRVDTPTCLGEIGRQLGYSLVGITKRRLDRNRRMMPARFKNNGQSLIEKRIHEEYVVGFVKP